MLLSLDTYIFVVSFLFVLSAVGCFLFCTHKPKCPKEKKDTIDDTLNLPINGSIDGRVEVNETRQSAEYCEVVRFSKNLPPPLKELNYVQVDFQKNRETQTEKCSASPSQESNVKIFEEKEPHVKKTEYLNSVNIVQQKKVLASKQNIVPKAFPRKPKVMSSISQTKQDSAMTPLYSQPLKAVKRQSMQQTKNNKKQQNDSFHEVSEKTWKRKKSDSVVYAKVNLF